MGQVVFIFQANLEHGFRVVEIGVPGDSLPVQLRVQHPPALFNRQRHRHPERFARPVSLPDPAYFFVMLGEVNEVTYLQGKSGELRFTWVLRTHVNFNSPVPLPEIETHP